MSASLPPPDAAAIAALVARHAPQARRFLAWRAGPSLAALLAAARQGRPDWVVGLEAGEPALVPLLAALPADPCLHLRGHPPLEPPRPGFAHPILLRAQQGLRPDVVLLAGPALGHAARLARRGLAERGIILLPPVTPAEEAALAADFAVVERTPELLALRPHRAAAAPPARPAGSCAIIVTVVGVQTEAEWEITGPSVRAYASAIGAELVVARDRAGLPGPSLKSAALPVAEAFDRVIMMDADILVRPHAPDLFALVPPEAVGAYPEARHFPRAAIAAEAAALHGIAPFPAEDYFNAGLMVLSRAHLGLLRALGEGLVGGRIPEQDTINVALHRLALPLHRLDPEFNLIASGRHLADWRCGWMLHTAGAPKTAYRSRVGWNRQAIPRGVVWTAQPLTGRALRLSHMAAQAARIAGQEAHVVDPDAMDHAMPQAFLRLMPDGMAATWLEPGGDAPAWPAGGRFTGLAPGRWHLRALPLPGQALPDCAVEARLPGAVAPLLAGRLAAEVAIDLPAGVGALEVALGDAAAGGAIAGLVLSRPLPPTIGDCHPPPIVPASD